MTIEINNEAVYMIVMHLLVGECLISEVNLQYIMRIIPLSLGIIQ